jgi:hypothetical protein
MEEYNSAKAIRAGSSARATPFGERDPRTERARLLRRSRRFMVTERRRKAEGGRASRGIPTSSRPFAY